VFSIGALTLPTEIGPETKS